MSRTVVRGLLAGLFGVTLGICGASESSAQAVRATQIQAIALAGTGCPTAGSATVLLTGNPIRPLLRVLFNRAGRSSFQAVSALGLGGIDRVDCTVRVRLNVDPRARVLSLGFVEGAVTALDPDGLSSLVVRSQFAVNGRTGRPQATALRTRQPQELQRVRLDSPLSVQIGIVGLGEVALQLGLEIRSDPRSIAALRFEDLAAELVLQ